MGRPRADLTGKRFGRWTIISSAGGKRHDIAWNCRCDCGAERAVLVRSLRNGVSLSCGCLRLENVTTHGRTRSREFKIWQGIVQRCHNPKAEAYRNYGGRGIVVCDRWRASFEAFFEDMGTAPSPRHSLDRHPNNDGNYEPGNVRWANKKQQARNTRTNRLLTYNGETLPVSEWAERIGVGVQTVFGRLRRNWPLHRILSQDVDPVRSRASRARFKRS
jgi:hypothetical protein